MNDDTNDFSDVLANIAVMRAKRTPEQIEADETREAKEEEERARRAESKRRAALDSLTPARYRWARADAPELQERVRLVGAAHWARHPPTTTFVMLGGDAGAGKTALACAAMRTAVFERRLGLSECLFVSASSLGLARIQAKAGTGEPDIVLRSLAAEWLLLDDLGSERDTATNAIPDVIFDRYNREATTWLTTGLSTKQIEARYGAGFLRRLLDGSTLVRVGTAPPRQVGLPS